MKTENVGSREMLSLENGLRSSAEVGGRKEEEEAEGCRGGQRTV